MCAYVLKFKTRFLVGLCLFGLSVPALADDSKYVIFEVRKKLQMSNDEPVLKDYYIGSGTEAGLKSNMIIDVKRKIPVHDAFKNESRGDLVVTVGKVKVIHAGVGISVARIFKETSASARPITGFETVMVGDFLDIKTAAVLAPKRKRKASSAEPTKRTPTQQSVKRENATILPTHAFVGPPTEASSSPVPLQAN